MFDELMLQACRVIQKQLCHFTCDAREQVSFHFFELYFVKRTMMEMVMSLHKDDKESSVFTDFNYESDERGSHHKKQVRRRLEDQLERKRWKAEWEDEWDKEFDWEDFKR
jgi:hypothetical protein